MKPQLSRRAVVHIAASLMAAERAHLGTGSAWEAAGWTEATSLQQDGLALDSLEKLACCEVVGRFFRLHETGPENRLLRHTTLGGWASAILASFTGPVDGFTFATSGTTGAPKLCRLAMAPLHEEACYWRAELTGARRVVRLVPPHHIYGFLFTALLPDIAALPVLDARMLPATALGALLCEGDVVVGFPTALAALARAGARLPAGLRILSATSALSADTHAALLQAGAGQVTDIYGSTETGGIAARHAPGDPFALLPWWRRGAAGELIHRHTGTPAPLPDHVEWLGDRHLRPASRLDGAVQVAGVNVYPARVAQIMCGHELVQACTVRLDASLPEPRLRAQVVPVAGSDPVVVALACERWARRRFSAPERPVVFDIVE
jgi:long-chain acyl-CoA synthetase